MTPVPCAAHHGISAGGSVPVNEAELRLEGIHVRHRLGRGELGHGVVREPGGPDLAFLAQVGKGLPVLLQRRPILGGPVQLVEVDAVHAQAAQRRFHLPAQAGRVTHPAGRLRPVGLVPDQATLGEDVRAVCLGHVPQRPPHDLLGVAEAVHGRGIHPVDPGLDRVPDRGYRVVVFLISPGEGPAPAANRPGPEAGPGDGHVCLPECNLRQCLAHAPMLGQTSSSVQHLELIALSSRIA